MFRDVKVGDKCWTIQLGDAEIMEINTGDAYPLSIGNVKKTFDYDLDGKLWKDDKVPSAFWSTPNIIPPPRPKRKVKKVIEGWINIYPGDVMYSSKEKAGEMRDDTHLGEPFFVHHEYEVEE